MSARQESGKARQGTRYRRLKSKRPHRWVAINPLRGQLVGFSPGLGSELLPHFLASRLVRVGVSLLWYRHFLASLFD